MLSVPVEGVVHAAQKTHPSLCVSDALAPKGDCKQHKALVVPPEKRSKRAVMVEETPVGAHVGFPVLSRVLCGPQEPLPAAMEALTAFCRL